MDIIVNFLKIVVFGIVEGITEWLPISSTGHMIILEQWLSVSAFTSPQFYELFQVVIQFGAIVAVIVTFFKKLWPFGGRLSKEDKKSVWLTWLNIFIACVPAGIVGLLFDDWMNDHLYNFLTVSIALIVYGVVFIVLEVLFKKKGKEFKVREVKDITWEMALIIGLAQVLALIPGTSRSGVTIIAAMIIGCSRGTSAEFSFCLSIPIMVAASLYKGAKFIVKGYEMPTYGYYYLIVGCLVAFLVSLVVIKYFMKLLRSKSFLGFGVYRVIFGAVLLILYFTAVKDSANTNYLINTIDSLSLLNRHKGILLSNLFIMI